MIIIHNTLMGWGVSGVQFRNIYFAHFHKILIFRVYNNSGIITFSKLILFNHHNDIIIRIF